MYAESFLRTMYISKTINSFILHPVLYGGCCFYPILLGSEPYFTLLKKKKLKLVQCLHCAVLGSFT